MIIKYIKNKKLEKRGFTLIELLVSISIFTMILTVIMGSIFSVFEANRKSQSLRAVMDNLNFTLESMTRTIRFGTKYHCDITSGNINEPQDCVSGGNSFSVTDSDGVINIYTMTNGRIARSRDGGNTYYNLTGSDVTITKLTFWIRGSQPLSSGDILQPRAIIVVSGYAGAKPTSRSTFTLETMVSQRIFDSQ